MFSSKSFIVSGLTFRSLIHCELIFVCGVKECSNFIFLTCSCLVFPAPFIEETVFPPLYSLALRHKYLKILRPFREVYQHTSCPDLSVTNFPIIFLPSPWPSCRTTGHNLWIVIDLYLWPFLLTKKTNNQMRWHSTHWKDFPSPLSFRAALGWG